MAETFVLTGIPNGFAPHTKTSPFFSGVVSPSGRCPFPLFWSSNVMGGFYPTIGSIVRSREWPRAICLPVASCVPQPRRSHRRGRRTFMHMLDFVSNGGPLSSCKHSPFSQTSDACVVSIWSSMLKGVVCIYFCPRSGFVFSFWPFEDFAKGFKGLLRFLDYVRVTC